MISIEATQIQYLIIPKALPSIFTAVVADKTDLVVWIFTKLAYSGRVGH